MEKIRKRSRTPSAWRARASSQLPTTTLARPQVDALGIEFHQEDVKQARVGVAHPGSLYV